ncbi:hypothetical protein HPP92_004684 [Vanilla planifolia]|uniref:Uncharacterized protein n=1 Tax=Vanilla planifolia TaxID=51239 RepID=A0A835RFL8_VANPL|nr:hypothetical protein HPP92_004684 [Vanilla planifolia]
MTTLVKKKDSKTPRTKTMGIFFADGKRGLDENALVGDGKCMVNVSSKATRASTKFGLIAGTTAFSLSSRPMDASKPKDMPAQEVDKFA